MNAVVASKRKAIVAGCLLGIGWVVLLLAVDMVAATRHQQTRWYLLQLAMAAVGVTSICVGAALLKNYQARRRS